MLPSLYISHGSPMVLLQPESPSYSFLSGLGKQLECPKAIVVMSAHWITRNLEVTASASPGQIYDFGGFPQALYEVQYPAPGDPALAQKIADLSGARLNPDRGLDHGGWMPLVLMYPEADIPVIQISLPYDYSPQDYYDLGARLAGLREEGVLIIGSGSMTHNLYEIERDIFATPDPRAKAAEDWFVEAVKARDDTTLLSAETSMPHYRACHPTDDHWFPVYLAMGAARTSGDILHTGIENRSLSMAAAKFE